MNRDIPQPHEVWRHFKGNNYRIIAVAEHTETKEQYVVYRALYGTMGIYCRPLHMFMSKTDKKKYPKAEQEYRFERVQEAMSDVSSNAILAVKEVKKVCDSFKKNGGLCEDCPYYWYEYPTNCFCTAQSILVWLKRGGEK